MRLIYLINIILLLTSFTGSLRAQEPDLAGVEIISHHVNGNVYMLEASGDVAGNTGVSIGEDGILIIDTQWRELYPLLKAALYQLSKNELKYVINTHHHDDHSDGNDAFVNNTDAIIITHLKTRDRLAEMDMVSKPGIIFDKSVSLFFNNEEIKLISFPGGHTDNDIIVWFTGSNVVHIGDLLNSHKTSFPTADYLAGGNAFTLAEILEDLLLILPEDIIIIPGHGPITNKEDLRQTFNMVKETIFMVESKIEQGMTLKEIISLGLPEKYLEWNHGYTNYESWIEMIYGSYWKKEELKKSSTVFRLLP